MKDKSLKEIAKDIDDGAYFKNAFDWYAEKHLKIYQERNAYFILFLLLMICATILLFQIRAWYPLRINRPVVIETSINSDLYLTMNRMSDKYKNPDYAILTYLLQNFVRMMEEYKKGDLGPLEIDTRIRRVSNNTTKEISESFADSLYKSGKDNPLNRFGNSGKREVTFTSVDLIGIDEGFFNQIKSFGKRVFKLPSSATLRFTTLEQNFLGERKVQHWFVRVTFLYSGVLLQGEGDDKKMSIPQFSITNYRVIEVSK